MQNRTFRVALLASVLAASALVACSGDASPPGSPAGSVLPSRTTGGTGASGDSHSGASAPVDAAKGTPATTPSSPPASPVPTAPSAPPAPAKRACATPTDSVTAAYEIALLRAPDNQGLGYWLLQLQAGQSRLSILKSFIRSDEFVAARAPLSDAQYVTSLYNGFLGRPPEAAELDFWTSSLASGVSRVDVAVGFVDSGEFADPAKNASFACFF